MLRLLAVLLLTTAAAGQVKPPAAATSTPPAPPAKAEFVGTETCMTCHEDIGTAFKKNPHQIVETDKKRGWAGKGCESCHGPGSNHAGTAEAKEIRNPARLVASESNKLCVTCHVTKPMHDGPVESAHVRNQIACVSCHKVHANGPYGLVARKAEAVNTLCSSCHLTVKAQFAKPHAHKVEQNAMTCVDCHNPHGSIKSPLQRTSSPNEPPCFSCHANKRGPFTFEHAPVRFEGCNSCHEPHGSANPKMLTQQEVRLVCLSCHANLQGALATAKLGSPTGVVPPAFHDLRSARYQNCTTCHQKIHGSHVDRNLLR